ncbi:YodL domain-containing protein [uncultured Oscillibacter sp.]|uniref:YodL domain-containing protein n=1 Tax=uncultured Oscillibacter sp. TaxID=876091 RepID=UPI0025ECB680|nr:YodL domain-containing protein [uncultured Oscillibacter sp.]
MPQIMIDTYNRIICYGNPAGYVKGSKAIVDPIFQTDELTAFLTKQRFETEWRDGVYDRLVLGQQNGLGPEAPALKSCRIWQLKNDTPVEMRFISYEALQARFGEPDPSHYAVVYDGQIETNDLEEIYSKFNVGTHPPSYMGHSMSMSDVVELYDDSGNEFFYCDRMGFQKIDFTQPKEGMEMTM